MDKKESDLIVKSFSDMVDFIKGKSVNTRITKAAIIDVKAIRITKLKITQEQFAYMLGVDVSTLRNWEQQRTTPNRSALSLLKIANKHPEVLIDVLTT